MTSTNPTHPDAAQLIDEAARLSARANRSTRWYAAYLVAFGAASLVMAILFSFVRGATGAIVLSCIWAAFVTVLSIWQARQKTAMVGMGRVHGWVIGLWSLAWCLTLFIGIYVFPNQLAWWASGGVLMALPAWVGAYIVNRRTRA